MRVCIGCQQHKLLRVTGYGLQEGEYEDGELPDEENVQNVRKESKEKEKSRGGERAGEGERHGERDAGDSGKKRREEKADSGSASKKHKVRCLWHLPCLNC